MVKVWRFSAILLARDAHNLDAEAGHVMIEGSIRLSDV